MNKLFPIITILKSPINFSLFTFVTVAFFGMNYYALLKLPYSDGFMCIQGGNVTTTNVLFSLAISVVAGLVASGLFEQNHRKATDGSVKIGSTSSAGLVLGTLTSFCTLCSLPVISLLGVGGLLAFMSEHLSLFKGLSLVILGVSAYLLNKQLKNSCGFLCRLKS